MRTLQMSSDYHDDIARFTINMRRMKYHERQRAKFLPSVQAADERAMRHSSNRSCSKPFNSI